MEKIKMEQINQEQMAQAMQCKTAEELMAFAEQNNIDLKAEEAELLVNTFTKTGELSDDELEAVAGGTKYTNSGGAVRPIVTCGNSCDYWGCKECGYDKYHCLHTTAFGDSLMYTCFHCKYYKYDFPNFVCYNPKRAK